MNNKYRAGNDRKPYPGVSFDLLAARSRLPIGMRLRVTTGRETSCRKLSDHRVVSSHARLTGSAACPSSHGRRSRILSIVIGSSDDFRRHGANPNPSHFLSLSNLSQKKDGIGVAVLVLSLGIFVGMRGLK